MPTIVDRSCPTEKDLETTFAEIYNSKVWGQSRASPFYSGVGSHHPNVVGPYVDAVRRFVSRIEKKLVAIDLGCGDFNVGRNFCDLFRDYTACDVVGDLISWNKMYYRRLAVRFSQLDIVNNPLPPGDLVFLRQVLQHLSNENISQVVKKLSDFRYMILTEHLPNASEYDVNVDKPSGSDIRPDYGSGVSLTEAPFFLNPESQELLSDVSVNGGLIRTIAYKLR